MKAVAAATELTTDQVKNILGKLDIKPGAMPGFEEEEA
jgi:hypothetical protein